MERLFLCCRKGNKFEYLELKNIQIEDDQDEIIDDELDFSMF